MRIAIDILSAALGGPGQYIRSLLPYLCRRAAGDEVHVLAAHAELMKLIRPAPNLQVHDVLAGRRVARRLLWQRRRMPGWLREHGIDVVFAPQGLTALRDRTPLVVLHQDSMYLTCDRYERSRLYHAVQQRLARVTLERCARALYVSQAIVDLAAGRGWLQRESSFIVPYGVDVADLGSAAGAPPPVESDGQPYLLTVSSVMPHKNVHTLVEAVARLHARGRRDLRLLIIGEAPPERPYAAQIRRQIADLRAGDFIHLLGARDRAQLGAYYAHARIYASLSTLESYGLTLVEAMSFGVPVLCNMLPAFAEVCGDDAVFVDGQNADATADALLALWDDEPRRADLAGRGRARAAQFDWNSVADAIYSHLCAAAQSNPQAAR